MITVSTPRRPPIEEWLEFPANARLQQTLAWVQALEAALADIPSHHYCPYFRCAACEELRALLAQRPKERE